MTGPVRDLPPSSFRAERDEDRLCSRVEPISLLTLWSCPRPAHLPGRARRQYQQFDPATEDGPTMTLHTPTGRRLASYNPGVGRLAPRASSISDAQSIDLDGRWRFRLNPSVREMAEGFQEPGFDDSAWDHIRVPGLWQMEGLRDENGDLLDVSEARLGLPAYTNVVHPFPVDPPHPSEDNPTGEYRREFFHASRPPRQVPRHRRRAADPLWCCPVRTHQRRPVPPAVDSRGDGRARHTSDLVPDGTLWLTLDLAHHGLGSASRGPDALPQHRLHPHSATLTLLFHAGDPERTPA